MKKSTGIILVIIILLLLGVIGVGGYFFIKENNETKKEIADLKNEVANSGKSTENTTNTANETNVASNQSTNTAQATNTTSSTNNQATNTTANTTAATTAPESNTSSETVLYSYSSADNSAAKGNGEHLSVYELNDKTMKFKYETPWDAVATTGTAEKVSTDLYVYEKDNIKVEILLNSMDENSVKVTQYENGNITSWKNLWK